MLRKTILWCLLILPCGLVARQSAPGVDSLIEQVSTQSKRGDFDAMTAGAKELLRLGRMHDDPKADLYGLIYTGHALAREVNDSVKYYYGKAIDLAVRERDDRAYSTKPKSRKRSCAKRSSTCCASVRS